MALYKFRAKDQTGKTIAGEVEVADEKTLVGTLRKQNLIPIEIAQQGGKTSLSLSSLHIGIPGRGVPSSELVGFTRQLSTMVSAGLPLTDALVILERQTRSQAFSRIIGEIVADVEGGTSLSASLGKHPKVFNTVYIKLVEAGETGGVLDKVLARLADTLEKDREFKTKTKGAFIYPIIVVSVMIIVVALMMIFVIPKLTGLYSELGAKLPLPTKILIAVSKFTSSFWWLLLLLVIGSGVGLKFFAASKVGSDLISAFVLRIPIWGKIKKNLVLAEFTRTLGLLIGTGIPIIVALKVVAGLLTSKAYKEGIEYAIERVERGSSLYQPLSQNQAFPPIVGQMLRIGEETGKMDEVLGRLAIYFENEGENSIRNLTTALEPVILVILGIGVGALVLSIILPIYNLTSQF